MNTTFKIHFIFLLLFAFAGCENSDQYTGSEYAQVEGTIRDDSGMELSNITVVINDRQTITGIDGYFHLDSLERGNASIELHGPDGIGRYALDLDEAGLSIDLTYPVLTTIVLLHDNDQHFDYNFKEQVIDKVEEYRARFENVWMLNTGDIFVRHADRWPVAHDTTYYAERSRFMIETMNDVGYDVMVPGNHEFDYIGPYTGNSLRKAAFTMVAANVDVATNRLPLFDPYTILETHNGMTVAVMGLSVGRNKPGVSSRDIIETARIYSHLAEENDLFVAITHIGYSRDKELAEEVPVLDVIIGGHSHTLLENAEKVNGVLVAQAGGGGHHLDPEKPNWLGIIKVEFENDRIIEKNGHVITIEETVMAD